NLSLLPKPCRIRLFISMGGGQKTARKDRKNSILEFKFHNNRVGLLKAAGTKTGPQIFQKRSMRLTDFHRYGVFAPAGFTP
ncbi:MAG: hypothetical protein ACAH89_02510, partial [Rariglobus sp.]